MRMRKRGELAPLRRGIDYASGLAAGYQFDRPRQDFRPSTPAERTEMAQLRKRLLASWSGDGEIDGSLVMRMRAILDQRAK
jgi:hypothetical protein